MDTETSGPGETDRDEIPGNYDRGNLSERTKQSSYLKEERLEHTKNLNFIFLHPSLELRRWTDVPH